MARKANLKSLKPGKGLRGGRKLSGSMSKAKPTAKKKGGRSKANAPSKSMVMAMARGSGMKSKTGKFKYAGSMGMSKPKKMKR